MKQGRPRVGDLNIDAVLKEHKPELLFNPKEEIPEKDFKDMKSVLESYRGKDWWKFAYLARNAYILAHKRIEFTRDGLRLVPLDLPFSEKRVPPEPERRNF